MARADALIAFDRILLQAYSRQTSRELAQRFTVGVAVPWLDRFLAQNVAKEIEKDKRVIQQARDLVRANATPGQDSVKRLLAVARGIDRDFLRRVAGLPVDILVPYEAVEPVRARRMERLLGVAHQLLHTWPEGMTARRVIATAMPDKEFEALVLKLLLMYADETRAISHALHLPMLLRPLRDQLSHSLYDVMAAAARTLSRQARATVYPR